MRFPARPMGLAAATWLGLAACGSSGPGLSATTSSTGVHAVVASTTSSSRSTPATAPSSQTAVTCPQYSYRPQSSDLAGQITATNTTCDVATRVVASAPDRPYSGQPYTALGFRCVPGSESQPAGGGMSHVPYRCDDGRVAVITFDRY